MVQHIMNVTVKGQELPKAVFRVVNKTDTPMRGHVVVQMRRPLYGQQEHRCATRLLQPGEGMLFYVELSKAMGRFYEFEWWVATPTSATNGKGLNSGSRKTFEGREPD